MARACGLLADPNLSIKEIAFELGFRTSSHFVTAFRRTHAVSPQRYREQTAEPAGFVA
jgi:AraC-like DNA-binding protein